MNVLKNSNGITRVQQDKFAALYLIIEQTL